MGNKISSNTSTSKVKILREEQAPLTNRDGNTPLQTVENSDNNSSNYFILLDKSSLSTSLNNTKLENAIQEAQKNVNYLLDKTKDWDKVYLKLFESTAALQSVIKERYRDESTWIKWLITIFQNFLGTQGEKTADILISEIEKADILISYIKNGYEKDTLIAEPKEKNTLGAESKKEEDALRADSKKKVVLISIDKREISVDHKLISNLKNREASLFDSIIESFELPRCTETKIALYSILKLIILCIDSGHASILEDLQIQFFCKRLKNNANETDNKIRAVRFPNYLIEIILLLTKLSLLAAATYGTVFGLGAFMSLYRSIKFIVVVSKILVALLYSSSGFYIVSRILILVNQLYDANMDKHVTKFRDLERLVHLRARTNPAFDPLRLALQPSRRRHQESSTQQDSTPTAQALSFT